MGCMQDYTYCTESCCRYTKGAGIVLESPTCDGRCGGRLSYPSPLPLPPSSQSNTACGMLPVSSVSCAGAETPRWRCVIARYLHAEIVQHTVLTSFFCMRILLSIQKKGWGSWLCHLGCGAHLRHAALCPPGTVISWVLSSWEQSGKQMLLSLSFSSGDGRRANATVSFLYDGVVVSILAACFRCVTLTCACLPILVIGSMVMVHCSWISDESIGLFWILWNVRAHVCVPCVRSCLSLCI